MGIYNLEHGSIEKHFFVSDDYHGGTNRPRWWVEQSFQSLYLQVPPPGV